MFTLHMLAHKSDINNIHVSLVISARVEDPHTNRAVTFKFISHIFFVESTQHVDELFCSRSASAAGMKINKQPKKFVDATRNGQRKIAKDRETERHKYCK